MTFSDDDFLAWLNSQRLDETFDGVDNYTCALARFLKDTGRATTPYVLSEEWYDEAIPLKRGKKPLMHRLPRKSSKAAVSIHPVNTIRHVKVRLELLIAKRDINDYYFEMRSANS